MKLEFVNIIDAIQFAVDKIRKQQYKHDTDSPPRFIVSQYDKLDKEGYSCGHEILLTIEHANDKRSVTIFPRLDYKYGYESLKDEMKNLYNAGHSTHALACGVNN